MQEQIASYLFQRKSCPLPGLGTLSVSHAGAEADFTNKLIKAPKSFIQFTDTESDAAALIDYLATSTGCEKNEATAKLDLFCDSLKKRLTIELDVQLGSIGKLFADNRGKVSFIQEELPVAFAQPVFAERVIHPDAEHQILVGDRETTNTIMTEMLAPKNEVKDRWWIWAIVLGIAGLLALLIYFTQLNGATSFGNTIKI
jgi:nucleoid DNA-binding protein